MTGDVRWAQVVGWHEYEVSDAGAVRRNGRTLAVVKRKGYATVNLSCGGRRRTEGKIHRLVLEAFVGPCPAGLQCLHANGIKLDNSLGNLSWGTPLENAADRARHGHQVCGDSHHFRRCPSLVPRGERNGLALLTESVVRQIRARIASGTSCAALAREFGVSPSTVSAIKRKRTWQHLA